MGDASEALLLSLFHHDIHGSRGRGAEYLGWRTVTLGIVETRKMGPKKVEGEAAWVVEDKCAKVVEKGYDLLALGKRHR